MGEPSKVAQLEVESTGAYGYNLLPSVSPRRGGGSRAAPGSAPDTPGRDLGEGNSREGNAQGSGVGETQPLTQQQQL